MARPILMPKPGQMTEQCVLVAWHKQEGDPVRKGDVLFEIETDKSVMEVEAFDDGVLLRRLVPEGQMVAVNTICAYVGEAGEAPPEAPSPAPSALRPAAAPRLDAAPSPVAATTGAAPNRGDAGADREQPRLRISPRASRLAAGEGIDPRGIPGTGPLGRITERDVRAALGTRGPASATGPGDVAEDEAPRPLSRMRRVIAERLTQSYTATPHFSITVAVDVTRLLAIRQELKATGHALSVTDFVMQSVAQSLLEYPEVNSRTDGTTVWLRHRVHLGLAVTVPSGLLVPVIRDAHRLSLMELHERAAALAEGARNGTLPVDDLKGSTFSVSNLGMFGVDEFSAIINPGEAAILAVSSAQPAAVVTGEGLAIGQVMKLTLSADHRLVDGELGARFLNAVRRRLVDAESFQAEVVNS